MNNTPTNYTPPESNTQHPSGDKTKLRRVMRANRTYASVTVVLSILLCLSMALNVALLLSDRLPGGDRNPQSTSTSSPVATDTTPSESTGQLTSDTSGDTAPSVPTETEAEKHDPIVVGQIGDLMSDDVKAVLSRVPGVYEALTDLVKTENRPKHVAYETTDTDESTDETSAKEKPVYSPGEVSFAYVDLTTGGAFGFDADIPRYTASIIKAPYIYAILCEVEEFEQKKHDFSDDGTALYDENGKALFEGQHPNYDAEGKLIYKKGEEKYDLSRTWIYNSKTMFVEGSGMIQEEKDGFTLTYLELIEYAIKYSDNIALEQLSKVFGYGYYHTMAEALGIPSKTQGFMHLSAADSIKFLCEIYNYFETGSEYARLLKDAMINSNYSVMIPTAVLPLECAHKYGWDVDAFHAALVVGTLQNSLPISFLII